MLINAILIVEFASFQETLKKFSETNKKKYKMMQCQKCKKEINNWGLPFFVIVDHIIFTNPISEDNWKN